MINPKDSVKLAMALSMTQDVELSCDECFEELDRFVETQLAGLDAAAAMPLVEHHLSTCDGCRDEYQALLSALRTSRGSLSAKLLWDRLRDSFRSG
jgi:hypothetical protein